MSYLKPQDKSTQKNLVLSLVQHGHVTTTLARAKVVQGRFDRLVQYALKKDVAARRRLVGQFGSEKITNHFVDEVVPNFGARRSGFTRIVKLGERSGDNALVARLEFVDQIQKLAPVKVQETKGKEKTEKVQVAAKKDAKVRRKVTR